MGYAIQFVDVSKAYGEKKILEHFYLDIPEGEFVTIIGSSGCGKTTVLKHINGLLLPDSGSVVVEGKDTKDTDLIGLRRNIGYAIQNVGLFPHMTVEKNIAYVPSLLNGQDKERTKRAVQDLMDVMGLEEDLIGRYPAELSGGQQQRVGIARALAARPNILLMDEPFGAVDEITRRMLQDEILRIHKELGVTIVFVTHDIREALKLGSQVLVMDSGKIEQKGVPREVALHPKEPFVAELMKGIDANEFSFL
ncbi:MAG: ATP-binding cassette domain-containing protein [Christensenellaceae bacterium]|jgi:osmoprotectant transport system ATP-binding protein